MASLKQAVLTYFRKNILLFFLLGFSAGLPLSLVFGSLSYWLKGAGIPIALIGYFSLARLPYTFKFLWAPFVDTVALPFSKRIGNKKVWTLLFQTGLMGSILLMSFASPQKHLAYMGICAFLIAFFSASQDIVIDGLRILVLKDEEQSAGAATYQLGYRLGLLLAGAGGLLFSQKILWNGVYFGIALLGIIGMIAVLCLPKEEGKNFSFGPLSFQGFKEAFLEFTTRPLWKQILLFIVLYKLSNAVLGVMAPSFYVEMGFPPQEIAAISNVWGTIMTIVGTLLGGILVIRKGVVPSLFLLGGIEILTSIAYFGQALMGHNLSYLTGLIAFDNIVGGMGATVFITYLTGLCSKKYATTEYALLSAFAMFSRDLFAAQSGVLASFMGWPLFFIMTGFLMFPSLFLLSHIRFKQKNIKTSPSL
ncbi:MAG: MFS transporter [Alphaproteobacteria bacterium]|nr:MFS transporter [Alphaproteobacteria bacterium]